MIQFFNFLGLKNRQVVKISRRMRLLSIIFISISMITISMNFYLADAVYAKVTALPVYIFFFLMMFTVGIFIDYASLWCKRNFNYHCTSVTVQGFALVLVAYEIGAFYAADQNVYAHPPAYSLTSVLSQIVT